MKQVSNAYKLSMKSLLREQSFVEITFSQVDTAAATDGNWVSNGAQSYSEFDTLDYGYDYQESYAALELNRWALDGNTVIGNGLAVECSPRWANNVQITAVGNIGKKNGYNTRMWKKHGHLPYVTYDKTVTPAQPETVKPVPTTEVKAKGVARSFNKAVAGTYTVTAGAGLNVRDAAGTDSKVLVTIPKGTTVKNYGYYTVVNGVKWLYVAFSHKRVNYTGFVHERFLSR